MIGLDTNVLVRYFAQDHPVQARTATEIVEERLTAQNPGFISTVVMAETVWVLDRAYRLADTQPLRQSSKGCCKLTFSLSRTSSRCFRQ
jgi:predicted nucleic-acid-binding protein